MKIYTPTKYFLYGALFGMMFPIGAVVFQCTLEHLPLSMATIRYIHQEVPILYMIDSAPLFLGLFAYFGGRSQAKLEKIIRNLKATAEALSLHSGKLNVISNSGLSYLNHNTDKLNERIMEINSILSKFSGVIEETNRNTGSLNTLAINVIKKTNDLIKITHHLQEDNTLFYQEMLLFVAMIKKMNSQLSLIRGLGREINTLSINSSIEAYKLGSQGAGFSAIAKNIKSLSDEITKINDSLNTSTSEVERNISSLMKRLDDRKDNLSNMKNLSGDIEGNLDDYELILKNVITGIASSSNMSIEQKNKLEDVSALFSQFTSTKENIIHSLEYLIQEESTIINQLIFKV